MHLRTLVIITNADGTLAADTMGPEATNVEVGLLQALVSEQEPGTEDRLGKDVEDGIGDDLLIDIHVAGAVSDTPDAAKKVSGLFMPGLEQIILTLGRQSR